MDQDSYTMLCIKIPEKTKRESIPAEVGGEPAAVRNTAEDGIVAPVTTTDRPTDRLCLICMWISRYTSVWILAPLIYIP